MNNEDLLYTNHFVTPVDQTQISTTNQKRFQNYIEDKRESVKQDQIRDKIQSRDSQDAPQNIKTHKYEKTSIVTLDTVDRDKNMYPFPNDFSMSLGKRFLNVKQIRLISTEIPNTDQVIKDTPAALQNNKIYWQDLEDIGVGIKNNIIVETLTPDYVNLTVAGHGLKTGNIIYISNSTTVPKVDGYREITVIDNDNLEFYLKGAVFAQATTSVDIGKQTYDISVVPGNYTSDTLVQEIATETNLIKRSDGSFHYFTVSVNDYTDVITFNGLRLTQIPNNSLTATNGTGIITVTQTGHGYTNGQLITILGARTFSGIDSMILNGQFNINFIDNNTFSYEVNVNSIDNSSGGGNTIKTGKGSPFRLLFDTPNNTLQTITGFPKEDSTESINSTNSITTKTLQILSVSVGDPTIITTVGDHGLASATVINIKSISIGFPTMITTMTPHEVTIPTRITINHSDSIPSIDGEWILTPLSPTTFTLEVTVRSAGTQGLVKYGGDQIILAGLGTLPALTRGASYYVEMATNNTFEIDAATTYIDQNTISDSTIGTDLIYVNHLKHGFRTLTSISNSTQNNFVNVTFSLPHNLTGSLKSALHASTVNANTVNINFPGHRLTTGALVYISDSTTTPSVDGKFNVAVVDTDTIQVNVIGGLTSPGTVSVATGTPITISKTNCVPAIDGTYYIQVVDDYNILIKLGYNLSSFGTYGILGRENSVVLYRIKSDVIGSNNIAGIPLTSLNGVYRNIVTIIDEDNYTLRVTGHFATSIVKTGGTDIRVSSEKHGYSDFQSNTTNGSKTGTIYRSINLSGQNYVYLVSDSLDLGTVYSSSGIQNSFAKILLSESPGSWCFNTFISAPAVFDSPIPYLDSIAFKVLMTNGYLFNFNDIDFSFSLEIVEIVDSLNITNLSSRNADQLNGESQTSYNLSSNIKNKKSDIRKLSPSSNLGLQRPRK